MKILFLLITLVTINTYSTIPQEESSSLPNKRPTTVRVNRIYHLFKSIGSLSSVFLCLVASRYIYIRLASDFDLPNNARIGETLLYRLYFCGGIFAIIGLADTAYYKWQTFTESLQKCLDGHYEQICNHVNYTS